MHQSVKEHLKTVAPVLLQGKGATHPTPVVEQRALEILEILQDYEWHTARQIAEQLGLSASYVGDILRSVQNDWSLISSTSRNEGWKMLKDNEPIII